MNCEKIIGVWALYEGFSVTMPRPKTHADLLEMTAPLKGELLELGFMTNTYRYVNYTEAFKIAMSAGQIVNYNSNYLGDMN